MTLEHAMYILRCKEERPTHIDVRFTEKQYRANGCDWLPFTTTISVAKLREDWWSDCEYCPENDTEVFNVMLCDSTGAMYLIDSHYPAMRFDYLLESIDYAFYDNKEE